ncbi:MAG: hypothetical protein WDN06_18505 [Asticcacaulis sp.]
MAWYDALLELEHAGDEGLRPFQLEKELLLPAIRPCRACSIASKPRANLVRQPFQGDKRGQVIVITETGKDLRRRMWAGLCRRHPFRLRRPLSATKTPPRSTTGLLAKVIME